MSTSLYSQMVPRCITFVAFIPCLHAKPMCPSSNACKDPKYDVEHLLHLVLPSQMIEMTNYPGQNTSETMHPHNTKIDSFIGNSIKSFMELDLVSKTHQNIWAHSLRPVHNILNPITISQGPKPQSLVPALHQKQPALWAAPTCRVSRMRGLTGHWGPGGRKLFNAAQGLEEGHNGFNGATWAMRDDTAWPSGRKTETGWSSCQTFAL